MRRSVSRRDFLAHSAGLTAAGALSSAWTRGQTPRRPHDYIVVEGHRDIWEFNDRFDQRDEAQHSPLRDFPCLRRGGLPEVDITPVPRLPDNRHALLFFLSAVKQVVHSLDVKVLDFVGDGCR